MAFEDKEKVELTLSNMTALCGRIEQRLTAMQSEICENEKKVSQFIEKLEKLNSFPIVHRKLDQMIEVFKHSSLPSTKEDEDPMDQIDQLKFTQTFDEICEEMKKNNTTGEYDQPIKD